MADQDYYELLGVSKTASADDIKKAYRRLAMKYHLDRNPATRLPRRSSRKSVKLYAVLSDEQKRAAYDRFGKAGVNPNGGAGGPWRLRRVRSGLRRRGTSRAPSATSSPDLFGGGRGGRARRDQGVPGNDMRFELEITLEEAARGTEKGTSASRVGKSARPATARVRVRHEAHDLPDLPRFGLYDS